MRSRPFVHRDKTFSSVPRVYILLYLLCFLIGVKPTPWAPARCFRKTVSHVPTAYPWHRKMKAIDFCHTALKRSLHFFPIFSSSWWTSATTCTVLQRLPPLAYKAQTSLRLVFPLLFLLLFSARAKIVPSPTLDLPFANALGTQSLSFLVHSNWETGASERHSRAKNGAPRGRLACDRASRSHQSLDYSEKRKGLRAVRVHLAPNSLTRVISIIALGPRHTANECVGIYWGAIAVPIFEQVKIGSSSN